MTNLTYNEVARIARDIFAQLTGEDPEDFYRIVPLRWEKPIEALSEIWFDDFGGYDFEVEVSGVTYQCRAWGSAQANEGDSRQPITAVLIDGWIAATVATPIYY